MESNFISHHIHFCAIYFASDFIDLTHFEHTWASASSNPVPFSVAISYIWDMVRLFIASYSPPQISQTC